MIPKDSKCAQKLSVRDPLPTSALNIPMPDVEMKINNTEQQNISESDTGEFDENISGYSTKEDISGSKLCTSPILEKKDPPDTKPRSMSDGTLRNEHPSKNSQDHSQDPNKAGGGGGLLKTILDMLPSEFANGRRQNSVHPAAAPNTSSEDSGISVDNSIARKTEEEARPSQEDESDDESGETTKRPGSSVLSLKGLFGGSSSSHLSTSTSKEARLSPSSPKEAEGDDDEEELETSTRSRLTSSGSSAGYDNLGFVPVEILSRRSSIFSDASC